MDSTKLLTEKLTLARELSSLKPEIDHLRSQLTTHQALLAEKLSLQRQVSTLEVELETERRSAQRLLARENQARTVDAKVEHQVEMLQAELTKERRERQRLEREVQKMSSDHENRRISLESRLDAFRSKLKSTKEQLKETRLALERVQNSATAPKCFVEKPGKYTTSSPKISRKRTATEANTDSIIGTPGDRPAMRKSRIESSLVGEKSTFSITPFLNRTAGIAPDGPLSGDRDSVSRPIVDASTSPSQHGQRNVSSDSLPRNLEIPKSTIRPINQGVPKNPKPGKAIPKNLSRKVAKAVPVLEQVTEEGDTESNSVAPASTTLAGNETLDETVNIGGEVRRKKRKLFGGGGLGKTIFDEEEEGMRDNGGPLDVVKGFGVLVRGKGMGPKFGATKALGSSLSTFGAISPLKKDRKAAV